LRIKIIAKNSTITVQAQRIRNFGVTLGVTLKMSIRIPMAKMKKLIIDILFNVKRQS